MTKNVKFIGAGSIVAILTILAIMFGTSHNKLNKADEELSSAWDQVEESYDMRLNLVNSMLGFVQSVEMEDYSAFEAVAEEYVVVDEEGNTQDPMMLEEDPHPIDKYDAVSLQESEQGMTDALTELLEKRSPVPEFDKNSQWMTMKNRLETVNAKINRDKATYNHVAEEYNDMVSRFPSNMSAQVFDFETVELFDEVSLAEMF